MSRITKMKFLIIVGLLALLCVLVSPASRADDLSLSLDTPIAGNPGDVITVFGDITNNTTSTIYFVDEGLTFNDPASLSGSPDVVINAIFGIGPASIDPGTLTGVDLFTLTIDPTAAPGLYNLNYYDLIGSTDPSCTQDSCSGSSGTLEFSVTVNGPVTTPEPGSLALLASGLLIGLLALRRAGR